MSLHNTTAFGCFLFVIVVGVIGSVVVSIIGSIDWVIGIPILFILGSASIIWSAYDASKRNSNTYSSPPHVRPEQPKLPQNYVLSPRGPGSCVHLTKALFGEVSAAIASGQMTQQDIAQKFNIPTSVVSRVKKGKINVKKLAD